MTGMRMHDDERAGPTLVFIIGPPAVGKMTVGQHLAHLTGFRLLHNHQIIDLLTAYFAYGSAPFQRLVRAYKRLLLEEAAHDGLDLIITFGWRFDDPVNAELVSHWIQPYLERGGRVYFIELLAPLETRLERNRTENRHQHKRTDWSTEHELRRQHLTFQDSGGSLPFDLPLLRIDTEHLTAEATAQRIRRHFSLPERSTA
jgi:hypothetical protein